MESGGALDLAEALGTTAKLWMNLQATYDLHRAYNEESSWRKARIHPPVQMPLKIEVTALLTRILDHPML